MEAVNFPERLLNGDWNCTSGNWFYIASHYCKNHQIYSFLLSWEKPQIYPTWLFVSEKETRNGNPPSSIFIHFSSSMYIMVIMVINILTCQSLQWVSILTRVTSVKSYKRCLSTLQWITSRASCDAKNVFAVFMYFCICINNKKGSAGYIRKRRQSGLPGLPEYYHEYWWKQDKLKYTNL